MQVVEEQEGGRFLLKEAAAIGDQSQVVLSAG